MRPTDLFYRFLDKGQKDLRNAGSTIRSLCAEICQPAVMGSNPGPSTLVVRAQFSFAKLAQHRWCERWRRIGKDDFANDAFALAFGESFGAIPVAPADLVGVTIYADAPVSHHLAHQLRDLLCLLEPILVLGLPFLFQKGAVEFGSSTGMAVRGDQQVGMI